MNPTYYPMIVVWSEEDQAWLARVPDLPGCVADGGTPEEALSNARVIIGEWVETATELGREVPKPSDDQTLRDMWEVAAEQERKAFEEAVEQTAKEIVDQVLPQIIEKVRERVETEQPRRHIFYGTRSGLALAHSG